MAVGTHLYSWVERGTVSQSYQHITGFTQPPPPFYFGSLDQLPRSLSIRPMCFPWLSLSTMQVVSIFISLQVFLFIYYIFLGLSNFNSKQVDDILSKSRIKPAVLQVECHPYFNQAQLIEHCRKRDIVGVFKHSTLNNSSWGKQFICVLRQSILDITGSNEKTD